MLKLLIKKQLYEVFKGYFYDAKKGKARSKQSTVIWFVFFAVIMVGLIGGMFGMLAFGLCPGLCAAGLDWLYFAIMGLISVLLGVFGSVFNTYAGLYLAKDNDLLLSMPIPVKYIIVSRLINVYLLGLMYSGIPCIASIVVYGMSGRLSAMSIIGGIIMLMQISALVLVLSCLLGWVVAKISLKLKNKSFVTVIVSLVGIGVYYFFYFKAQDIISDILQNAALYGAKIKGTAYIVYLWGQTATGDVIAIAVAIASSALLLILTYLLLEKSFIKLATSTGKVKNIEYKATALKAESVDKALLRKELGRFTSSANYMLNCGFGMIFIPTAGVFLFIVGAKAVDSIQAALGTLSAVIPIIIAGAVCTLASMNMMAAPSVSLEGKNIWLMQSLPIEPWKVIWAKIKVQLILTYIPMIIFDICFVIAMPFGIIDKIMSVALSLVFVLLSAFGDMFFGIKMPNLSWTDEIKPIKQSACVCVALFGGWGYSIAIIGLGFAAVRIMSCALYLGIMTAVTLGLSYLCYMYLKGRGARIFAEL